MSNDDALARFNLALTEIERAAAENVERSLEIQRRVGWFRVQIDAGVPIGELVACEESPRVVELITANMSTLEGVGSEFRAALALALRADGLTIEAIAGLYGVTRQRVSALLRQRAAMKPLVRSTPEAAGPSVARPPDTFGNT